MAGKSFDVVILGATGFTGRQAVRAMRRQGLGVRWAVAGRNVQALQALVADDRAKRGAARPGVLLADTTDADALATLAAQARVLINLAGPYALTGDAVVQACIDHATHYLDLTGETFWVRGLIERRHDAARAAGVKIIPSAGYEVLPFDLATLWIADALRKRFGVPCREVRIVVSFTGRRLKSLADAASGGTIASMRMLLERDSTDSVRNVACLLPPERAADAAAVARRSAIDWLPRHDAALGCVVAPTVPAPFINPPMVLRSWALIDDESLFTPDFRYHEGSNMASLIGAPRFVPPVAALALQFAAAASLAGPLAGLGATVAGPLQFQRQALRKLIERFAPQPGEGPSEAALAETGYAFDIFASGAGGETLRGRMDADGHAGYRSTPEMLVAVANGLAAGTLGRTPHVGIVTPASGLGIEAVAALEPAGVRFSLA
ncbi:MAG: saccharopine dehydrogenase NADP-binding domain-containing protein [Piscinibacter sp.]|nr:saccharopine dehydrogenase NADP-binding domain-containing protein [Piscinibacter sp.]